jgi:wyosine [tRNA(Phe)-imidazoG37] synthetase (radical SAM superfamily)
VRSWSAGWPKTVQADVITFAGSGEPTLYSRLGGLIAFIKEKTAIPVIVLSNGTLLHRADVREELLAADVVKVSLSAWDEDSFRQINRPAPGVSFGQLVGGEKALRQEFDGELWLEVFLMEGINAAPEQVQRISAIAETICPDRIHLNTAVRPAADASVRAVSAETLASFCEFFTPRAEVIASFSAPNPGKPVSSGELAELIRRHPATAEQLAALAGVSAGEIVAALAPLAADGTLRTEERGGELYYL